MHLFFFLLVYLFIILVGAGLRPLAQAGHGGRRLMSFLTTEAARHRLGIRELRSLPGTG